MNSNPYLSLLQTAWQYARNEKKRYLLTYGLFTVAITIASLNPLLYGWFIDALQQDAAGVLKHAWLYAGGYFLLRLGEWAFHGPARILERELAFTLSRNFLDELYHQVLHLPVRWHQDHHSGATINRLRKAHDALKLFFDSGFMHFYTFFKFFFSFAAMLYFSPLFGMVGIGLGLLNIWLIFRFDKPFIKTLEEVNEKEHIVSATLFDSLSNILTVLTLRLEKRMQAGLLSKLAAVFPPLRRNVRLNEWKWFVADMMVVLIYVVITVGYVWQHWQPGQVFLIGGLITLLGFVNQFTSVFHDVAWQYTQIVQYNTDVETVKEISEAYQKQHRPQAIAPLPDNWQTLDIRNLNFSHGEVYDQQRPAQSLHHLNLRIRKGEKIAFIGESGSGKSTLLSLLRGLYEPENDLTVSLDGKSYPNLAVISDTVTLFPQEPEIFENTLAYNITLGLSFEEADIRQVCETAHFTEVLAQLPKGLESNIQEKGVNLSGGQKQRLALARGILAARGSDIILLDEPTSSVDPKTEARIYDRLFQEFEGKAILSALHRLHLLTRFDYVYVLHQGHIADEGTFEHLRQHSPVFQELWQHQTQKEQQMLVNE